MKIILLVSLALNLFATELYTVQKKLHSRYFENEGHVKATYHAKISAQTTGVVTYVAYDVGDTFSKGVTLLKISSVRQFANVEEARLELENAELDAKEKEIKYIRLQKLDAKHLAKDEDMTAAKTAYDVANKTVSLKKEKLSRLNELYSYTRITAPFSAVIKKRYVHRAEKVSLGSELFDIYNTNYLRILVTVPESLIQKVKKEHELLVIANQKEYKIDFDNVTVYPSSENYAYTLRIKIPKGIVSEFHDGNFVGVRFKVGEIKNICINKKYIHQEYETPVVYIKHADNVYKQFVRLGNAKGSTVEIISGIKDGDILVYNEK